MAGKNNNQTEVGQTLEAPRQWYRAGDDVEMMMENLVRHYHPHLLPFVDRIAILFKTGTGQKAGQVSKASPQMGVLADKNYVFVIKLMEENWANLADNQRIALMDHLLCACKCEEAPDASMKFHIDRPDLEYYRDELDRNGFWRHSGMSGKELVGRIFDT